MWRKALPIVSLVLVTIYNLGIVRVFAEEIAVSGNGEGSVNQVTVQNSASVGVAQTNEAAVNNSVSVEANTGANTASGNQGEVAVTTGDVNAQTAVQNSVNNSIVDVACCGAPAGSQVAVSGNGADSQNTADVSNESQTNVVITQMAQINNMITGTANTGENVVTDNNGDVTMKTGDITVTGEIKNGGVNSEQINVGNGGGGGVNVEIKNNGVDSQNIVTLVMNNSRNVVVNSNADIQNEVRWDANTGRNEINGNNGVVSLVTGDIILNFGVINDPINSGGVDLPCCGVKPTPTPTPTVPPVPTPTPGGGGGTGGDGGGGGGGGGDGGSSSGAGGAILAAAEGVLGLAATDLSEDGLVLKLVMIIAGIFALMLKTKKDVRLAGIVASGALFWFGIVNFGVIPINTRLTVVRASEVVQSAAPTRIKISDLSIDLAVAPAKLVDGYWEVFSDRAGWGEGSAEVGKGNTVIFAHARQGLFYNLRWAKPGMRIEIDTPAGMRQFEVTEKKWVWASDTSVIKEAGEAELTLFTCAGRGDLQRVVVKAKLV